MKNGRRIRSIFTWVLIGFSVVLLVCALTVTRYPGDTESAAGRLERVVSSRMDILDSNMQKALEGERSEWMSLPGLPEDMVVYRYQSDSLQSWSNQFPIINDDISTKVVFQVLSNPRAELYSPLSRISPEVKFLNLGSKYYLAYSKQENDCLVIGGLEIMDMAGDKTLNGVNPMLRLGNKFSVGPLSVSGGTTVTLGGVPQFKVLSDTLERASDTNAFLVWMSLLLFLSGLLLFLINDKTAKRFSMVLPLIIASLVSIFIWGMRVQSDVRLFSPILYADGPFLYSLGALLILNLAVTLIILCVYIVRKDFYRRLRESTRKYSFLLYFILILTFIVGTLFYTQFAFRSIISNSNITLELYKLNELSLYTCNVYISFIFLLMTIPMLLQLLRPFCREYFNIRFDVLSNKSRFIFSTLIAIYLVTLASVFGFKKEQARIKVWANMLSIERDVTLELALKSSENSIANDVFIGSLSLLRNSSSTILNRIVENDLYAVSQNNSVSVFVLNEYNQTPQAVKYFNERVTSGIPISEGSRFSYYVSNNGRIRYTGAFVYFNNQYGVTHLLVEVEPKAGKDLKGSIIPPLYSYAKYNSRALSFFRGYYPYPTKMDDKLSNQIYEDKQARISLNGYVHFVALTSENEAVLISRPVIPAFYYLLAGIFLSLLSYCALSLMTLKRRRNNAFEKNYYKARVSYVLISSLIGTLVTMATVSIVFVYRRYDANNTAMMSDKVTALQAMVENYCRGIGSSQDIATQENSSMLRAISDLTTSEIVLYSTDGKLLLASDPDSFGTWLRGSRVNEDAFNNIIFKNRRYYIQRMPLGQIKSSYILYAPVFNEESVMVAIMCSPYSEDSFDFENEAVLHLVSIITVFALLLILARFMILTIVERMFKPLSEMGKKMSAANVEDLEYIEYDRDDEIASLVKVYNGMVTDLSESSKKLAQAERDKAWSAMARQVAHEIKNPLTPMKLQIQRIIRLKAKDDPQWQTKFDEATKIILDHIDILTDTANEFSTFAKLYSEDPVEINLDEVLMEEIAMFDNRDNIEFSYAGLENAVIYGPKPQLTRVFVNLINNAIQALEDRQDGRIFIALRKSTKEGYYDIVFEDNGPGVPAENQSKLFTPNFTTKSSGTGLGLAISRSILERCGAEINYSKSFTLGGACFTITIPK